MREIQRCVCALYLGASIPFQELISDDIAIAVANAVAKFYAF